eukprot:scaffold332797_cov37-Prasinocladus_malaysianus.AAC.1
MACWCKGGSCNEYRYRTVRVSGTRTREERTEYSYDRYENQLWSNRTQIVPVPANRTRTRTSDRTQIVSNGPIVP